MGGILGGGGFFGGGSSSSESTSSTTSNETVAPGYDTLDTAQKNQISGVNLANAVLTVKSSDQGSIAESFGLGKTALDGAYGIVEKLIGSSESVTKGFGDLAKTIAAGAQTTVTEAGRSETENLGVNLTKWAGLIGLIVAASFLVAAFRKG